jgi:hypothetical protein
LEAEAGPLFVTATFTVIEEPGAGLGLLTVVTTSMSMSDVAANFKGISGVELEVTTVEEVVPGLTTTPPGNCEVLQDVVTVPQGPKAALYPFESEVLFILVPLEKEYVVVIPE